MAVPNSRQTLKDYCLRQLGAPVLEINVDDSQLEDRIDDAFQLFQEHHFDGTQKLLLKHKITGTEIDVYDSPGLSGDFSVGEVIKGSSTGVTAKFVNKVDTNTITVKQLKNAKGDADANAAFSVTEELVGQSSGVTGRFLTLRTGDVDNQYIPIDSSIIGVERVLPFDHAQADVNMFDVRYQLHLNDLYDLKSTNLAGYNMSQERISQLEDIFNQAPRFAFNRHMDRLYLDIDWADDEATVGKWVIVEAYKIIDPNTFTDVYNDIFLKKYLTILFKKQWGSNLIKFEGMQLPGGVTLNGRQLYDDAVQELERLEETMELKYQLPDDFMVG